MTHCRQVMLEELQRRNFAPTTISAYLHAVEQFARHFKCRPDRLNQTHFRSYQAYLLRERKMRPLTSRLHVAALRFFFVKVLRRHYQELDLIYPKLPERLPTVLSEQEVAKLIESASSAYHRVILTTLYATGMRRAELARLKVSDIDSQRMMIHVRQGKGGKLVAGSQGQIHSYAAPLLAEGNAALDSRRHLEAPRDPESGLSP